jgi:Putative F0F1-ATPase subunit Ca2+/Mg2+ transporter
MEYAIQLLIPILVGLCLGNWLSHTYHTSPLLTMFLAVLGFALGIGVLAKKSLLNTSMPKLDLKAKHASSHKEAQQGKWVEKQTGILPNEMDFLYKDYSHEAPDRDYDFLNDLSNDDPEKHERS